MTINLFKIKKPPDKPDGFDSINDGIIHTSNGKSITKDERERYDKYISGRRRFRTKKAPLDKLAKNANVIRVINDAVDRMNDIKIHTYHMLLAIHSHKFENGEDLPILSRLYIEKIMKTVADPEQVNSKRAIPEDEKYLRSFYDTIYRKTLRARKKTSYALLSKMIWYEAGEILTAYENHISNHFDDMLRRYVNILVDIKKLEESGDKDQIRREVGKIKNDLLYGTATAHKDYDHIKQSFKVDILKDFKITGNLSKMGHNSPLKLIILLMRMSQRGELILKTRKSPDDPHPLVGVINVFPLSSSVIPGYVTFDTAMINDLFAEKGKKQSNSGNISGLRDQIWSAVFRTDNQAFKKKGYVFRGNISTDGYACSVLLILPEHLDDKFGERDVGKKPYNYRDTRYVEELTAGQKAYLSKKNIFGFDPGTSDLLYGTNGNVSYKRKKNGKIYRVTETYSYSNAQRKHECLTERYRQKILKLRQETVIRGKTVIEIESELSAYNSSSCIWSNVFSYLKTKNSTNFLLKDFYKKPIFRKQKWYGYLNKNRSEDKMVDRFAKLYGGPEETVVVIGDFSRNQTPRGQEPVRGKFLRKKFKDRGYVVLLVNEFRTSCRHYGSGEELETFRWDKENSRYVHKLLGSKRLRMERAMNVEDREKSQKNEYGLPALIHRDLNGALNIRYKALCILRGEDIPDYLKRPKYENKTKKEGALKVLSKLVLPTVAINGPITKGKTSRATKIPKKQIATPINEGTPSTAPTKTANYPVNNPKHKSKNECVTERTDSPKKVANRSPVTKLTIRSMGNGRAIAFPAGMSVEKKNKILARQSRR